MSFLPILLSKIKLHHVSELGVTCWVCCVCGGGVSSLVLFLNIVRRFKNVPRLDLEIDLFVVDRLNIYGEPIVREFHSLLRAVEGQPFTLHCPWAGYPMEKVGWEKGERQRHFPSSLLVILSANHVTS